MDIIAIAAVPQSFNITTIVVAVSETNEAPRAQVIYLVSQAMRARARMSSQNQGTLRHWGPEPGIFMFLCMYMCAWTGVIRGYMGRRMSGCKSVEFQEGQIGGGQSQCWVPVWTFAGDRYCVPQVLLGLSPSWRGVL